MKYIRTVGLQWWIEIRREHSFEHLFTVCVCVSVCVYSQMWRTNVPTRKVKTERFDVKGTNF